jgi:hypothetical protein
MGSLKIFKQELVPVTERKMMLNQQGKPACRRMVAIFLFFQGDGKSAR